MFDSNYINTVYENYKKTYTSVRPNVYLYNLLEEIKSKNLVEILKQDLLSEAKVLETSFNKSFIRKENTDAKIINNLIYDFTILQEKFKHLQLVLLSAEMYEVYGFVKDALLAKQVIKEAKYYKKYFTDNEIETMRNLTHNNIFELDMDFIKKIYNIDMSKFLTFKEISLDRFNQLEEFLTKSKYQITIKGILHENILNIQEIVYMLFSKLKDSSFLTANLEEDKDFKFGKYTSGFNLNVLKEFAEYQPFLNSDKTTLEEVDKLIFIKNLIQWCKTGCFVGVKDSDADNYMYSVYLQETKQESLIKRLENVRQNLTLTKQKLHEIYDDFNEKVFVNMQANYIYSPEIFETSFYRCELKDFACKIKDGILNCGFIVSIGSYHSHLIHVSKDLNVENGKFEIQLNKLSENKIENRVQLLRIDNYETDGVHKNWGGERVKTKTHVHIYNQFDLLRGRVNGNFDIAYNLESEHQSFDDALDMLFKIINFQSDKTKEKIKDLINKEIESYCENSLKI